MDDMKAAVENHLNSMLNPGRKRKGRKKRRKGKKKTFTVMHTASAEVF